MNSAHLHHAGAVAGELAAEVLRRFGRVSMNVLGSSMLPAIRPHDTVHVRSCAHHDVSEGQVVVFSRWGRLFVHRVVEVSTDGTLVTQGDSLHEPDPRVHAAELIGRVEHVTRRAWPVESSCVWHRPTRIAAGFFRRSSLARWLLAKWRAHRRGTHR